MPVRCVQRGKPDGRCRCVCTTTQNWMSSCYKICIHYPSCRRRWRHWRQTTMGVVDSSVSILPTTTTTTTSTTTQVSIERLDGHGKTAIKIKREPWSCPVASFPQRLRRRSQLHYWHAFQLQLHILAMTTTHHDYYDYRWLLSRVTARACCHSSIMVYPMGYCTADTLRLLCARDYGEISGLHNSTRALVSKDLVFTTSPEPHR